MSDKTATEKENLAECTRQTVNRQTVKRVHPTYCFSLEVFHSFKVLCNHSRISIFPQVSRRKMALLQSPFVMSANASGKRRNKKPNTQMMM